MSLDHREITALFDRFGPMVLRRCRRMLRDEAHAEDAAQDVFVQFLKHRDRLTSEHPSSLLYRIATNHCLNLIRGRAGQARNAEAWLREVADMEDPAPRLEARSILGKLFGRHQESTRTMAVLHLLDGMTLEEVAKEVGLSVSGVRKRLQGLRASLADVLADLPPVPHGSPLEAP